MSDRTHILPHAAKGDLTTGPVERHLVRLTVPMIWGILAIISFQLVDTFYVSLLGAAPLAAISFTFPVTYTVFSLVMGMSIAMSSVVSRQLGEGSRDRARRIVTHGLILAFMFGGLIALTGYLLIDPVFTAMGADQALRALISDYMPLWFLGSIFLAVPMVGNAALRAGGNSATPAMIMGIAAGLNVILDPLLIFGLFGLPRLELQGAALATLLANAGAMLAGMYVLYARTDLMSRDGLHLAHFADSLKRLAYIALPAGLTATIQPLSSAVIIALLAGISTEAVAAFGVASRLEAFAFTIIMALATGMAPVIGQNWGAKRYDRVYATLKRAFTFAVAWSLLVGAGFILFTKPLALLFAPEGAPAFGAILSLYFWIVALTYAPGNLVPGWSAAFNAIGRPGRSFTMIVVKMMILQLPLAVAGARLYGLAGIFAAIALTNVLSGIFFHWLNSRALTAQTRN